MAHENDTAEILKKAGASDDLDEVRSLRRVLKERVTAEFLKFLKGCRESLLAREKLARRDQEVIGLVGLIARQIKQRSTQEKTPNETQRE